MTTAVQAGGGSAGGPQSSGLADVIDTILDKGLVIDAYVRLSLVGIELITIDARVVIASVDTYLRFAEAVNRLDISDEKEGLPELVGDVTQSGARRKTKGALEGAGQMLKGVVEDVGAAEPAARAGAAEGRTEMTSAPPDTQAMADSGQQTGCYVYGILPGDAELTEEAYGVADRQVKLVRSGGLAALVSEVDLAEPLGTPRDFQAHKELLDSIITAVPVLPLRFGTVLTVEDAVVAELLDPHHDEFATALEALEGQLEYVVKGRYVERAALREILSGNSEAAALREQIRGKDPYAAREGRIRLGEIISDAVAQMRDEDTGSLLSRLEGHCTASFVRDPTHELDAVHVALLVAEHKADEVEQAVDSLAAEWEGRVDLRLLGPMAPYDFVSTSQPGSGPT